LTTSDLVLDAVSLAFRILFLVLLYYFVYKVARLLVASLRASHEPQDTSATLTVIDPGSSSLPIGYEVPVHPVTSLGRSLTNSVVIDDPTVSSEHAILLQDGDRWWLSDRGSRVGTTLNGNPVVGPVRVEFGDTIGVGGVKLKLTRPKQRPKSSAG
jgi:pSer/pThr/pTyr-binding forkhead associated (FHA) protein